MKKFLSVLLALLLLVTAVMPVISVSAADEKYITVYVEGYGHGIYKNNTPTEENRIPMMENFIPGLLEEFMPLTVDLFKGFATEDYNEYCDRMYNAIAPAFSGLRLDKNGEASDGSGFGGDMLTGSYRKEYGNYPDGKIIFEYDWRLSVEHNAAILEQFIDRVCTEEKVEKVNILGRCLGGNIISAYLQNGKNLNKVNDVVMLIASTEGVDFISALFSGNVKLNPEAIDSWANYFLLEEEFIKDPEMVDFVTSLVSFMDEIKVLGLGTAYVEFVLEKVKDNVLARIVRDTFGSFPSFWAMVSDEYFEEAVNFVYSTEELKTEYANHIEKIRSFHDNVQIKARDTMKAVKAAGHEILVISKYNYQNLPLSKDYNAQSDGTALTEATSFGAFCAEFGSTLSESYINGIMTDEEKKYLSPDNMIDASTCLFPETTWFIKNCYHNNFPASMDKLIVKFMNSNGMTVFTDAEYPQFVDYDKETGEISPVEGLDKNLGESQNPFDVFLRFFKNLFNFIKKLFSGEMGNLFG